MARPKPRKTSLLAVRMAQPWAQPDPEYLRNIDIDTSPENTQDIENRAIAETRKLGGGLFTMDFVTLGMFIIGWSIKVEYKS